MTLPMKSHFRQCKIGKVFFLCLIFFGGDLSSANKFPSRCDFTYGKLILISYFRKPKISSRLRFVRVNFTTSKQFTFEGHSKGKQKFDLGTSLRKCQKINYSPLLTTKCLTGDSSARSRRPKIYSKIIEKFKECKGGN